MGRAMNDGSPRTSERDRLVLRGALIPADRLGVALDLRVHRVAQSKALVAELVHELGFEHSFRSVNVAYGFEKAEREKCVDRSEHATAEGDSGGNTGRVSR